MASAPTAAELSPAVMPVHGSPALDATLQALRTARDAAYSQGPPDGEGGRRFTREDLRSGLDARAGAWLAGLVRDHLLARPDPERPARTIETGLAFGLSSLWMIEGMLLAGGVIGGPVGVRHTAIDPRQSLDWDRVGLRLIGQAGVAAALRVVELDSSLALPAMVAAGERADVAFVDGHHAFQFALIDLWMCLRLVGPGGLVVIDDLWCPGPRAAFDFAANNLHADAVPIDDAALARRIGVLRGTASKGRRWDELTPFSTGPAGTGPTDARVTV